MTISATPDGNTELSSALSKRSQALHRQVRATVSAWADTNLSMLSPEDRLLCVYELRMARSYREMYRKQARWQAHYRKTIREIVCKLAGLIDRTPPEYSSCSFELRDARILEILEGVARNLAAQTPALKSWRKQRPNPIFSFKYPKPASEDRVYTMDAPMPLLGLDALTAARFGRRLVDRLRSGGVPALRARKLAREGLGVAGIKVDPAIRFNWKGPKVFRGNTRVARQPDFVFEVGKGGAPRRLPRDPRKELAHWTSRVREWRKKDSGEGILGFIKRIEPKLTRAVHARRGSPVTEKEVRAIRRAQTLQTIEPLALAKLLTRMTAGAGKRYVNRLAQTSRR